MKSLLAKERQKPRLQFKLGTLLVMMALCGSAMAYYLARSNRQRLTTQMNILASLEGRAPVADVSIYSLNLRNKRDDSLALWIPRRGQLKICWATNLAHEDGPAKVDAITLSEGSHTVRVRSLRNETSLLVDNKIVFNRRHSKDWNVAQPISWELSGDHELTTPTTVVLATVGIATLRSDEAYDAEKHRFGLKIWLER